MSASATPAQRTLDLLIATVLFAGAAEVAVRIIHPTPRGQIARLDDGRYSMELYDYHGSPVWRPLDAPWRALREPPCMASDPATTRTVALAGDSILYVTGGEDAHENVGYQLQQRLDAAQPGAWCVINTAVFAYSAEQKRAALAEAMEHAQVDQILWEVWGEAPTYKHIGGTVYAIGSYATDEQGYPYVGWMPVPGPVNRALFRNSRAWEYLVIALGPGAVVDDVSVHHRAAIADAKAEGADLSFWFFPDLQGPLTEPPHIHHETHPALRALLAEQQAKVVEMRPMMADQDYEAIRLTTCCHYNPRGHAVVADKLAAWLLATPPNEATGAAPATPASHPDQTSPAASPSR